MIRARPKTASCCVALLRLAARPRSLRRTLVRLSRGFVGALLLAVLGRALTGLRARGWEADFSPAFLWEMFCWAWSLGLRLFWRDSDLLVKGQGEG